MEHLLSMKARLREVDDVSDGFQAKPSHSFPSQEKGPRERMAGRMTSPSTS